MQIKAIVVIGRISNQKTFFTDAEGSPTHFRGSVDLIEKTETRYFLENSHGVTINDRTDGPMSLTLIPWHRIGEVRYV